jgi:hypothetical protein
MFFLEGSENSLTKRITKRIVFYLIIFILILGIVGCSSLEDAAEKAKPYIPEGYTLVHVEQVSDNSGVVFYTDKNELSVGIFIKNSFGWDWIGSGIGKLVTYPEGLQWRYADLVDKDKNSFSLYYGKVINNEIEKITVTTTKGDTVEGKIVDTDQLRLWYAFVSEPQIPSVNADIVGYSKEDKVIYLFSQPKE